jgi:uncharacterized surface protein with fasciclin (FAS1) repeats
LKEMLFKYLFFFLVSITNARNTPVLQTQDDAILPKLLDIGRDEGFRGNSSASILSNLAATPSLSKLYQVIKEYPSVVAALADKSGNYTLFAPLNSAIPSELDVNDEYELLVYHLVQPSIGIDDMTDGQLLESKLKLATLGDKHQRIKVFKRYDNIYLNWHSKIQSRSIKASNGWIHLISTMLKPPSSLPSHLKYFPLKFSILSSALKRTGVSLILNEVNGATMFAPTNSAFVKLGWRKLQHLFSDEGVAELSAVIFKLIIDFIASHYSESIILFRYCRCETVVCPIAFS